MSNLDPLMGTACTVSGDAQAIIDVAQTAVSIQLEPVEGTSLVAYRSDQNVQFRDIEEYSDRPVRTTGTYKLGTTADFKEFVESQEADHLTVWVDGDHRRITAVFNDAAADAPAWRDHRAILALETSEEWDHWLGKNGTWMSQQAFAEHIEDGIGDIRTPDPADMLEVAQSLQATKSASFRSATRLANGEVQYKYEEDVTGQAGRKGDLEIPEKIALQIPPFLGEDVYAIDARFRYRISGEGELKLMYKLDHPDRVLDDAIKLIATDLKTQFGAVYVGQPAT